MELPVAGGRVSQTLSVGILPPGLMLTGAAPGTVMLAAMLAAAMPVYDALYEWCRNAQGERHSWPAHAVTVADR